ncbi:hypothetical protein PISMIDRAFT_674647 [Pisolithus microcarpus 441]|uniref:Uncharacterized protein n=1 Tax=Pisolithus microcarpus 441 TaxID=765257 RepID=A0A0D0A6P5_9AGAM|nr:hypothetical protein PISMIDRAFT_674647 [Pisolithus microcarpus 441]
MNETAEVTPMQAGNETAELQRSRQREARENPTGIKYTCFRADLRIVPCVTIHKICDTDTRGLFEKTVSVRVALYYGCRL